MAAPFPVYKNNSDSIKFTYTIGKVNLFFFFGFFGFSVVMTYLYRERKEKKRHKILFSLIFFYFLFFIVSTTTIIGYRGIFQYWPSSTTLQEKQQKNTYYEATVHTHLFAGQPRIRRRIFGEIQKSYSVPAIHIKFQQVMETVH